MCVCDFRGRKCQGATRLCVIAYRLSEFAQFPSHINQQNLASFVFLFLFVRHPQSCRNFVVQVIGVVRIIGLIMFFRISC